MAYSYSYCIILLASPSHSTETTEEHQPIQEFSSFELKSITLNYKELIGVGGYGKVYKGSLSSSSIAVKVLHTASYDIDQSVYHRNNYTLLILEQSM